MITNQIMERPFLGITIYQQTKNQMLSATDLLALHNNTPGATQKEVKSFMGNKDTQEFLTSLCREVRGEKNTPYENCIESDLYNSSRGRGHKTRMHPYLFVKFAMWLNKDFEVKVLKRVHDNLIAFRHSVGDNYKEMCNALLEKYSELNEGNKPNPLIYIQEANFINDLVCIQPGCRNELNEGQLEILSKLQKANINFIKAGYKGDDRKRKLRDFRIGLS